MKLNIRSTSWLLAALLAATGAAPAARAADAEGATTETVKFSDPSKPGTLKLTVANGDIRITGSDAPEVSVTSEARAESSTPRADGLRVLTASSSYSLVEKNNVVTLSYGSGGWPTNGGDFTITVPHNTNVVISNSLGGDIDVQGVTGDLEIKSLNGEVKLADVSGGALVETMNGEIHVTVQKLVEGKPLSFSSMNGEVQLRIPADGKASLRLRTHNGTILTDFDDKQLVTKTTSLGGASFYGPGKEIQAAVRDAVRVGMEAAREATRAAREAVREARQNHSEDADEAEIPEPPVPPMAPLPPMTGGKMVTGTLNGGGPEIRVTTMNGNVTLRKTDAKKS
jgi:hypothetical protein